MAWLERIRHKNGTESYWIRDFRDGKQIVIKAGETKEEAIDALRRYRVRRDLEKEGYEDKYQQILDDLWGQQRDVLGKAGLN